MDKKHLYIITQIQTVQNIYKSSLNEQDEFLLNCFLLILKKEGVLSDHTTNYKENLSRIVENTNDSRIKDVFYSDIKIIVEKSTKLYFNSLCAVFENFDDNFVKDNFLDFYDNLLIRYFGLKRNFQGYALQPKEMNQLMNYFLPKKSQIDYYNPFGGLASLALDLPENINYRGEEIDHNIWLTAKLRMIAYNCPEHFQFDNINSIENWHYSRSEVYDYICFNPPFNLRLDESYPHFLNEEEFGNHLNANSLIISQTFKKLKKGGKLVFVMPNGFLFSESPKDKSFKKFLVENNHINTIISLPIRILNFTAISINLIVLSKNKENEIVRFVDASNFFKQDNPKMNVIDVSRILEQVRIEKESKFTRFVDKEVIENQGFNLEVNRYVNEKPTFTNKEKENLVELSKLIKEIPKKNTNLKTGKIINIGDLSNDKLNPQLDIEKLKIREIKSTFSVVSDKALLVSLLGNDLKPSLFEPNQEEILYNRGNVNAFKIDDKTVLAEYLVMELHKDYVQKQIAAVRTGSGIPRISKKDLLKLQIIVPPKNNQELSLNQAYYKGRKLKELELLESKTEYVTDVADENSFLRHQIAGYLRNVRSDFKFIKSILENKVYPIVPDLYSFKPSDELASLEEYLKRMDRDIKAITNSVNRTGSELDLLDLKVEKIDLIKFINKYVEELRSSNGGRYTVEIIIDQAALDENKVKSIYIDGDKELLRKMLDNIIENADKHGFKRKIDSNNKIEFQFIYDFENAKVQLDVSNTGVPMPENYMHSDFIRKGSRSGHSAGDGTGGWFINEVIKLHKGSFEFTDETGIEGLNLEVDPVEVVTSMELTFPIKID